MNRCFGMKAIAFLLAFIMAFTVMPSAVRELVAYVSAEGEGPRAVLDKTAVLQDDGIQPGFPPARPALGKSGRCSCLRGPAGPEPADLCR